MGAFMGRLGCMDTEVDVRTGEYEERLRKRYGVEFESVWKWGAGDA
jgi:hypothetical protein